MTAVVTKVPHCSNANLFAAFVEKRRPTWVEGLGSKESLVVRV